MDKMKVLNKATVLKGIDNGMTIQYYDIYGKVYLVNQDGDKVGAIRFDTYLSLKLKEMHNTGSYLFREYRKAV